MFNVPVDSPPQNNVRTIEELQKLRETNRMIRDFVNAWDDPTIPNILLMDFGGWIDQLIDVNARLMGMDRTASNYTLERLGCFKKYPPSVAQVCSTLDDRTDCTCVRNMMCIDGMHWCMESLGGRIMAGTACLLRCSLVSAGEPDEVDSNHDQRTVHATRRKTKEAQLECERRCNDEFMSLKKASSLSIVPASTATT
jgi:hypothetical protein